MHRCILIVALVCGEVAVVLGLRAGGPWQDAAGTGLRSWLSAAPLEDAVIALVGTAAAVCAGRLVLASAVATFAYITRIPALVRSIDISRALPRRARRIAFSVLVTYVLATTPVGAEDPPMPVDVEGFLLPPALAGPAQFIVGPPDRPANPLITVRVGDNLWAISTRHLSALMERRPEAAEIAAYWRRVIQTNRGRLSSGDPDLIYPGEVVEMPPIG